MNVTVAYINPTRLLRRPLVELANRVEDAVILVPRPLFGKQKNPWHNKVNCKVQTYPTIKIPFIQFDWPIPVSPSFFVQLWRIFRDYDVVHMWTFFYISSWASMLMKKLFPKTKLIMSCDTFPAISFKSGFLVDNLFVIYYHLFYWTLKIPDVVHLYSEQMKKMVFTEDFPEEKIKVIPTGIDIAKFDKAQRDRGFKNKLYVTYAGMITKRKGFDRYVKESKKLDSSFYCISYGEGPDFEKYLGNSGNVVMHKWSNNLPHDLKNTDVLILLSRGEGLPGIVMEAMACKVPVIATDIPGNNDLVEHEETGFLCKRPEDVKLYLEVLKNKKFRKYLGEQGYKKIKQYDWKKILPKYENMYEV
jgi:glycosyltransferase involved in cell wall biosynthesis